MKYVLLILAVAAAGVFVWRPVAGGTWTDPASYLWISPCDTARTYRIGTVDPRFGISAEEVSREASAAADVWNQAAGRTVLAYEPAGTVSLSMMYDERQKLSSQVSELQGQLGEDQVKLKDREAQFAADVDTFNRTVADFTSQVEYWNSHGGAPPDVYDSLTATQRDLRAEETRLRQEADNLNLSSSQFNTQVDTLHQIAGTFSQEVAKRPEEGIYDDADKTIEIYFYLNRTDLMHTLVHEFGHALGIGHVNDPQAVMYMYSNKTVTPVAADLAALTEACRKRTVFEVAAGRVVEGLRILYQRVGILEGGSGS